jgi:predicted RNA-binding Zn-ribbon protein involved in translation (DUF1610 family)
MIDPNDPQWQKLSGEILSGMKEWVAQHPKATFAEIECETMRRMAQLQARILEDVVQGMEAEARQDRQEAILCPECGAEMQWRGEQDRRLQAQGGQEVVLKRGYAVCPQCGAGFFPPG